ncbi:unnamed protein product [Rotaria socialis]|uniref:Uncharacterized protein n=1 Tax=Rotaria socialis TaxID=392032 RepID=A0A820LPH6_9BILA|nr:unnamed protein product [Rotaria socialis]CAF4360759.1 unnamed protein product [Rotaria socialis]
MASNCELDGDELEAFTLIWLDAEIYGSENKIVQNDLRQLSDDFRTFHNDHDCESFIESLSIDQRVVLITSGRFGREVIPRIHAIEQIYSIYIYCFDKETYEKWAKSYSKINGVITEKTKLIEKIRQNNKKEIFPINIEPLHINVYDNTIDSEFIHSQLLIDYLLKMKINSAIETQILSSCKTKCDKDNLQLETLEKFQQTNSSENSFDFLMKDNVLLKSFAEALQTKNINLLYLFRSFLRYINQQLEQNQCSTSKHVYFSYLIKHEEFEQLKNSIGKFISINTLLLTTCERDRALRALQKVNTLEKILFEIYADPSMNDIKPFAQLKSFHTSINQSQIVFMFGSIFFIENFVQQDDIWICRMNLSSQKHPDLINTFNNIKKEDGDSEIDLLSFANFLARIGKYDDAENYYQYLLRELPLNHEDVHVIFGNLGNVAYLRKDYDRSLEYHLKSIETKKCLLEPNDQRIADSYNCLGIVYFNRNNYRQAIESYEAALNILKLITNNNQPKIAACLSNIGLVYRTEKNYLKALDYYKNVLEIEKKYLSEDHTDLGQTYHTIGALYWCCGYCEEALKYYNLSLENKKRHLSSKPMSSMAMTLENIGLVHENKNDFQEALKYYEAAAPIYRQTLSATHADVLQIENNISRVLSHLEQMETF